MHEVNVNDCGSRFKSTGRLTRDTGIRYACAQRSSDGPSVESVLWALMSVLVISMIFFGLGRLQRWRLERSIRNAIPRVPLGSETSTKAKLLPESLYVVQVSDAGVACTRPDGRVEQVTWSDLRRVEILTTDAGPFAPDVFWVLHGTETGCVVPQGASGEPELLDRLFKLPGFDFNAAIEASSSASVRTFLCWERRDGLERS
jgi:hypothetical protein